MEATTWGMWLQPRNHEQLEEAARTLPRSLRGENACTRVLMSWTGLRDGERMTSWCFKVSSWW